MTWLLAQSDARRIPLADGSVHCVVCSPPFWGLRDYNHPLQIGLEPRPELFVASVVATFREVRRVLRDDGCAWLNLGDTYYTGAGRVGECPGGGEQGERWKGNRAHREKYHGKHSSLEAMGPMTQPNRMKQEGLKPKDIVGIPWRCALAPQADGWFLRSDCVWFKPNPLPESVKDRPGKAHEYVFLLTKSERYFYNDKDVRLKGKKGDHPRNVLHQPEPSGGILPAHKGIRKAEGRQGLGSNLRTVWRINVQPTREKHFAAFPPELAKRCILAGCPQGGIVLDPFCGIGTTGIVATALGCQFIGFDLKADYLAIARRRIIRPHKPIPRSLREEPMPLFKEASP